MKKMLAIIVAALMLFGVMSGALAQPARRVAPVQANRAAADAVKAHAARFGTDPGTVKDGETLDQALNVDGGTFAFTSEGTYPWAVMTDAETGRVYAQSTNAGVASSTSVVSTTVNVGSNKSVKFEYKAWGEGTSSIYDKCIFAIDGNAIFTYGKVDNDWTEFIGNIGPGEHTLTWTYSKDTSVNPDGDYFAVDNVEIIDRAEIPDDPDLDAALNVSGGNIHFHSFGDYPWTAVDGYAANGNTGVHSSVSELTATVTANAGELVNFNFKAWGESSSSGAYIYDHCRFYVDGTAVMDLGAYDNENWETFNYELTAGEHELKWSYQKDSSDNPTGDYFYVDEVFLASPIAVESITAPAMIEVPMYRTGVIEYTVLPANATNKTVTFTSADPTIATVDPNGVVHGIAVGQTTVTVASVNYPDITATVAVKVFDSGITAQTIYAIAAYDPSEAVDGQWMYFTDMDPVTVTGITAAPDAYAAAYAYGNVYGYTTAGDFFYAPFSDLSNVTTIAGATTYTMLDMAMDYTTGIMYGLGVNASDAVVLVAIDIGSGAVVDIGVPTIECINLAIDENGNAYGIDFNGNLNSINLETAAVTTIGNTGMQVNYVQGMCYDFDTGDLYWAQYYSTSNTGLCRVDKATGACEFIDAIGSGIETCGMFIVPTNEPEPPADIPVTGVSITPTEVEIRVGDIAQFDAVVAPVNASNKNVEWDVDDDSVIAIDQNGTVIGISEGVATVYVTTEDGAFTAYATVNVLPPLGNLIAGYYFETDPAAEGWTFIDSDGDGYNWGWDTSTYTPYEGSGIIYSQSYDNPTYTALTPDNWAISPLIILPSDSADLTLYAQGQDSQGYDAEVFGIFVGTTDDITQMTKVGGDYVTSYGYAEYSVNLNAYAGQAIYMAIRHYNITDMFVLDVDQVEFWGQGSFQGAHQLTITYQYDDGTEAAPTYTATLPEGFEYSVTSPVIDGFIADIPVVEGVMGTADVNVTVTYVSDGSITAAGWYFETDPAADGWVFVDSDGDGFNWIWQQDYSNPPYCTAYEGEGLIFSESYDNDNSAALTPDNWAISPAVTLPTGDALVYLYACGQDANYAAEHFAIYVGTSQNVADMVQVSEEFVATGEYVRYEADLTAYAGQTVYIAIRHFNVTDMFMLNIDNVVVKGKDAEGPTVLLGDADCDGNVTFSDITALYLFLIGDGDLTEQGKLNANFDQDDVVGFGDISALYLWLLGI